MIRLVLFLSLVFSIGCSSTIVSRHAPLTANTIPAHQLPADLVERQRDHLEPLNLTLLRQPVPKEHRIGPRDILGIYIKNVVDEESGLPAVYFVPSTEEQYVQNPAVGFPIRVDADGTIELPFVGPVNLNGMTLPEAVQALRKLYIDGKYIIEGSDRIRVNLIRARSHKVFVMRDDSPANSPSLLRRDSQIYSKRGSAIALEMPVGQNDILHALTQSGGLPGADAFNAIWVLRGIGETELQINSAIEKIEEGASIVEIQHNVSETCRVTHIPLRVDPAMPLDLTLEDIVLNDGDVVYISSRDQEYFIAGGLLNGGRYVMPRDEDIDIFDAIAIANSNVNGPAGANAAATNFRSGPGNIIPPTRVVVVRKLQSGEQMKIRVDLKAAMNDPDERLMIQPDDLVLLKYKPGELLGNIALNFVNVNFTIPSN